MAADLAKMYAFCCFDVLGNVVGFLGEEGERRRDSGMVNSDCREVTSFLLCVGSVCTGTPESFLQEAWLGGCIVVVLEIGCKAGTREGRVRRKSQKEDQEDQGKVKGLGRTP